MINRKMLLRLATSRMSILGFMLILLPLVLVSSTNPSGASRRMIDAGANSKEAKRNPCQQIEANQSFKQLRLVLSSLAAATLVSDFIHSVGSVAFQRSTAYWMLASGPGLWLFLYCILSALRGRHVIGDPLLMTRLLGAGSIYWTCINNSLLNPSLGRFVRFCHAHLGRVGFVLGLRRLIQPNLYTRGDAKTWLFNRCNHWWTHSNVFTIHWI
jgi:hypothetical protein